MTSPTVPEKPPVFSVEDFAADLRQHGTSTSSIFPFAFGMVRGLVKNKAADPAETVDFIRNLVTAVDLVRAAADPANLEGFGYSRDLGDSEPDLPIPVSPGRIPAHVGAVVDDGELVDETSTEDAHVAAQIEDNDRATAVVRADLRTGEQRRIASPDMARYLAHREDARRDPKPCAVVVNEQPCAGPIWWNPQRGVWSHLHVRSYLHAAEPLAPAPVGEPR